MKATKYGNRYQITYRCPGFPRIINEYFDTLEEAELRISCIKLEKKRGTLTPPAQYLDSRSDPALLREKMTVSMLMQEYLTMYGLNHWSESTLSCNRHRINDYIIPYIGGLDPEKHHHPPAGAVLPGSAHPAGGGHEGPGRGKAHCLL